VRCALPGVGPHLAALSAVMIRSVRGGRRERRREKGERRVHGRGRGEAGRSKRDISGHACARGALRTRQHSRPAAQRKPARRWGAALERAALERAE
jgi:hypothetical protein